MRPRPRLVFDTRSSIVHSKTPKTADEYGNYRKLFQKWSHLIAHRFENSLFLVKSDENEGFLAFENGAKKASQTDASSGVFRRFSVDDRGKNASKNMLVWTGGNKSKTLAWSKSDILFRVRRDENVDI